MKITKERFLEKIKKDPITGCWEWTASKRNGYGRIGVDGKHLSAHRLSYQLFVGPIKSGLVICHKCDNPGCVNPDHIFIGTQSDNMTDMHNKGRSSMTFKKGHTINHKLSVEIIRQIKAEVIDGILNAKQIGQKLGVKHQTVCDIRAGRRYANVT